jgi:hypothetical protein
MTSVKTIPMPTDQIQELFLNPTNQYEVDLRNSKLKGESFITYIANMRMKCTLITDPELTSEEKFSTLTHFLNFNYFVDCDTLVKASALLMLRSRGVPIENTQTWISFEEMDEYIKLNYELITKIGNFYDSLVLAVPSFNINFKNTILDPAIESGLVEVIEDTSAVSINIFGALTIPDFLECFLAYPNESSSKLRYFKYPVERFSYNKKALSEIFRELKGGSLLLSLTHMLFSEEQHETEVLNKHIQSMGV